MKEYTSVIKLVIGGNNHEAKNEKDYIQKVKDQFYEEYGFELDALEITNIKEI